MNDRKPPEFAGKDDANLTPYLLELLEGNTLSEKDASSAFEMIMTGDAHHAEVGALLALLARRLPTTAELTGAARVMREKVDRLDTGVDPGKLLVDLLEEELVRAAPLWNSLFQGLDLLGNA